MKKKEKDEHLLEIFNALDRIKVHLELLHGKDHQALNEEAARRMFYDIRGK
jgi:hypothetical protein